MLFFSQRVFVGPFAIKYACCLKYATNIFIFRHALSPPASVLFTQNLHHAFNPKQGISSVSLGRKARKRPDAEIGINE
jgi:hypothetical protein